MSSTSPTAENGDITTGPRGIKVRPGSGAAELKYDPYGWAFDGLVFCVCVLHLCFCPFSKVEESFNTQAVFDLSHSGTDLQAYDHLVFPGVVPRTFLGPLLLWLLSLPLRTLVAPSMPFVLAPLRNAALLLSDVALDEQWFESYNLLCIRATLTLCFTVVVSYLRKSVNTVFGRASGRWFAVCLCLTFHLPFYSSRLLPNTLGLVLCALALGLHLQGHCQNAMCVVLWAACAFRCDLVVLAALLGLDCLDFSGSQHEFTRSFVSTFLAAVKTFVVALAVVVPLDTLFWYPRKEYRLPGGSPLVWAEGAVLWFNTAQNKSHLWGVQPVHWYFSSAIPRALGPLCVFALGGFCHLLVKGRYRVVRVFTIWLLPAVALSLLPHKELRFIFPTVLSLVALSGISVAPLVSNLSQITKKVPKALGRGLVMTVWGLAATYVGVCLVSSVYNYASGHAMQILSDSLQRNNTHPWLPQATPTDTETPVLHPSILFQSRKWQLKSVLEGLILPASEDTSVLVRNRRLELTGGACFIHVDPYCAMGGVSLFVHPNKEKCAVSKNEAADQDFSTYTFLVHQASAVVPPGFEPIYSVAGFRGWQKPRVLREKVPRNDFGLSSLLPQLLVEADVTVYRNVRRTRVLHSSQGQNHHPADSYARREDL